jgi:hypothetical protein
MLQISNWQSINPAHVVHAFWRHFPDGNRELVIVMIGGTELTVGHGFENSVSVALNIVTSSR